MLRPLFLIVALMMSGPMQAQSVEPPMSPDRLLTILQALDPDAAMTGAGLGLTIADVPVLVVFDASANRMRAMVPVASAAGLTEADLMRMMQANFDSALDARYAIANDRLWSVFIHPLRELHRDQLISGLAQTVTLARTYGSFYASGATVFGSGDSNALHDELLEELRGLGEEL